MASPFLSVPPAEWLASNALAFAIRDRFPVSPGHTLVIPRREVATYFDATPDEKAALWTLVEDVKARLDLELRPDGYNVGFNAGEASGQTVMHVHLHVIPRFRGDVADPRGGVRHVIPGRGNYLEPRSPALSTGGDTDPFSRHLWPLFTTATEIAIVAAFVTETGLEILEEHVLQALRRGTRVRLVTGDYLGFTQVAALRELLFWSRMHGDGAADAEAPAGLNVRVIETARADGSERAFHPKSWQFHAPEFGVAFVGSSNLSRSALQTGVEWNLRIDRSVDSAGHDAVRGAFEALWGEGIVLSLEWIDEYENRVRARPFPPPGNEVEDDVLLPPPEPHEFQAEALAALSAARAEGRQRGLVVLATGLGKTWLAALDVGQVALETGRWPRILFLAHRKELLTQAARTFRRLLVTAGQPADVGWCVGDLMQTETPIVVASVQKLARQENLERIAARGFGYVVVDEVHHADAPSYRRVLDALEPGFLLGLTATPDRADEGDILGLFDDFVAYRADLGVGIARRRLVPFAYQGLRDEVDYAQIPWRNRRFDPDALAAAVQTQRRMERLWQAWITHAASRTLVFCCSVDHARFARDWLRERGTRVEAVHSERDSADRTLCLEQLERGDLDAICVVDMFNEGVDVPSVDRVVMLRPTESPVVFLQQLGRGLRISPGKQSLVVIDFVGNHRIFLDRIRRLLSLATNPTALRPCLESNGPPELPPGCSVDVELEAKEMLLTFLPRGALEVERVYRELFASRGDRPTAGELRRMGYHPDSLRKVHGSWFRFVKHEGHLTPEEERVLGELDDWLGDLETTAMTKSFKMVVLEVLVEANALATGMGIEDLAVRCHAYIKRSPELLTDLEGVAEVVDPKTPPPSVWLSYWRKNPIAAWTGPRGWFQLDGERFVPRFRIPEGLSSTVEAMTRELVDYQLSRYRARARQREAGGDAFTCRLTWNQRDPILKLPRATASSSLPSGDTDVRLPDGAVWSFRFAKEFCNVARPSGTQLNRLPDLMRRWFGPSAGHPGTAFEVRFSRSPDGWWVEPQGKVLALPARGRLVSFPSLQAAAGRAAGVHIDEPEAGEVALPFDGDPADVFAVRATGDSMAGGDKPIQDGDWLIMRWARGVGIGAVAGRIALVKTPDEHGGYAYQVKRVVQTEGRWRLRSDNPDGPSFEATEETTPIALLVGHVGPEQLAPPVGQRLSLCEIGAAFGLGVEPSQTGRWDGHLFLFVSATGQFTEPDRLEMVVSDRRPGETAFVLAKQEDGSWRYCGVGRWGGGDEQWAVPALDFASWRALGSGRTSSRRLRTGALDRARALMDELVTRVGSRGWLERDGRRCRLLERTVSGLRIDGGDGGFAPRVVTENDVAWALVAAGDVAAEGGALDEARVNRLRYLEGTPKASTRWIDTGWALLVVAGGNTSPATG
jgi:superfamily II DNA or RNA helicase/diadenosine tetraphosphate (Ap4A) HIT family hydrolase